MTIVETERLLLREIVSADAPFVLELLTDPDFRANIGDRGVHDLASAERYVGEGPQASYARHGFGMWAIEGKAEGVPLGMCGLLKRDWLDHVDLGYAFLPAGRGRGYALEAARATMEWAAARGIAPVLAIVDPDNRRSLALLDRLGFARRGRIEPPGEAHSVLLLQKE